MKVRVSIGQWQWLWVGATVCGSVLAEPRLAQEPAPSEPAPVVSEPPLRLSLGTSATGWSARAALDLRRIEQKQFSGLSIVELPPEGLPTNGRTRPRHALSVSSEYPKMMLRSIGIEATDCATRFRMPTKLRRDAEGGTNLEFRADLGLACRF